MRDNTIHFTGIMRELFLQSLAREIDVIDFMSDSMDLTHVSGSDYKGRCPKCGDSEYHMNGSTGLGKCESCNASIDFLDFVCLDRGDSLDEAMSFLSMILAAFRKAASRRKGGAL